MNVLISSLHLLMKMQLVTPQVMVEVDQVLEVTAVTRLSQRRIVITLELVWSVRVTAVVRTSYIVLFSLDGVEAREHLSLSLSLSFLLFHVMYHTHIHIHSYAGATLEEFACECDQGWTAYDCSERSCPKGFAWGFGPPNGQWTECSNRGTCDITTGICVCDQSFTGSACQIMQCPTGGEIVQPCSGHGNCVPTATSWDRAHMIHECVCDPGYCVLSLLSLHHLPAYPTHSLIYVLTDTKVYIVDTDLVLVVTIQLHLDTRNNRPYH